MKLYAITIAALLVAAPSLAQEQQAGNSASANADETFQALIEACDVTDILVLRGRLRVQIPRITEDAAAEAQDLLDQGMAKCGEGDIDGAKAIMVQALEVADKGATENFGTDGSTTPTETASVESEETAIEDQDGTTEDKPWWQFW